MLSSHLKLYLETSNLDGGRGGGGIADWWESQFTLYKLILEAFKY